MEIVKKNKLLIALLLFSFALSALIILPYFHPGYFPTHDGEWAVIRLSDMFRELRDHQIPARYSGNLNFGYGYPLFNFAYPFPYYLGVILHFLHISFVDSIKILFAITVPLSSIFMFFAARELWKSTLAGFVSSVFFVYYPYRIVDLYIRGSLGESLAFVLFPAIFFFVIRIINQSTKRGSIALVALLYGALILTHNIMAAFFSILLLLFLLGMWFEKGRAVIPVIFSLIAGLGVAAFFFIPALLEKQYILLSQIPIADRNLYYVTIAQLLTPRWGGYGVPIAADGFSYQLGLPHVAIALLVLGYVMFMWFKKTKFLKVYPIFTVQIFLGVIIFFLFLLFHFSSPVWKLPFLSEINYPWTILGPLGFLLSLAAGFLVTQKSTKPIILLLALASIFYVLPYAKPQYYVDRGDLFYITNEATTTSSNELMPLWVKKMPNERATDKVEIIRGDGKIENIVFNSKMIQFTTQANSALYVHVNIIYYPGWEATIDGINTPISFSNNIGVMEINIPPGDHFASFSFRETQIRLIADVISVISLVFICGIFVVQRIRNDKSN